MSSCTTAALSCRTTSGVGSGGQASCFKTGEKSGTGGGWCMTVSISNIYIAIYGCYIFSPFSHISPKKSWSLQRHFPVIGSQWVVSTQFPRQTLPIKQKMVNHRITDGERSYDNIIPVSGLKVHQAVTGLWRFCVCTHPLIYLLVYTPTHQSNPTTGPPIHTLTYSPPLSFPCIPSSLPLSFFSSSVCCRLQTV